jgi:predicted DNA-binding mobile mystery protein A
MFKRSITEQVRAIILDGLEANSQALNAVRPAAAVPARGWLRAVREAVGLTQSEAAMKAGIKRQSFSQFETSEARGAISIESMRRAAGALDCELVYFIIPREGVASTFAGLAQLHDPLKRHLGATEHSMRLKGPSDPDERS